MKNKEKKKSSLDYQDDVSIKDAYSPTKESLPEKDKDVNIWNFPGWRTAMLSQSLILKSHLLII